MELTTKRSNFWYILPIVLGLLGGVIAYFVLRKSDSKKAKICLILGIGISAVWWIGVFASSGTSETNSKVTTTEKTQEEKIAEQKIYEEKSAEQIIAEEKRADQIIAEQKIADQRDAENKRIYQELQREAERQKELQSKFDPIIVASAKKNIPDMLALPKGILAQCKAVKSFSDYETFAIVIGLMSEDLTQIMLEINVVLSALELDGYDKHPEVGPLIRETRSVAGETGDCITDLVSRYAN